MSKSLQAPMTKAQMRVLLLVLVLDLAIISAGAAAYLVTGGMHWVYAGAALGSSFLGAGLVIAGRRSAPA